MAQNDWDAIFAPAKQADTGNQFDAIFGDPNYKAPEPSGLVRRVIGDAAVSAAKSVVGAGETVAGLANLATGGLAGKGLDAIGYRPKATHEILDSLYSPEQQAGRRAVSEARGVGGTLGALAENPSTIPHYVIESLAPMVGGQAIAKGGLKAAGYVGEKLTPSIARLAGATGEGLVTAGATAEQIRQENPDGNIYAAVPAGILTTGLGVAGGKLANKVGLGDIDTALLTAANRGTASMPKRVIGGAFSEGLLEELPQSMQEQAFTNLGTGKPLMEGVPEAGAMGAVLGGTMGGGFGVLSKPAAQEPAGSQPGASRDQATTQPEQPLVDPSGGPLSKAAFTFQVTGAAQEQQWIAAEQAAAAPSAAPNESQGEAAAPSTPTSAGMQPGAPQGTPVEPGAESQRQASLPPADSLAFRQRPDVIPAGSFGNMNELADMVAQERADVEARRASLPKSIPTSNPQAAAKKAAEFAQKTGTRYEVAPIQSGKRILYQARPSDAQQAPQAQSQPQVGTESLLPGVPAAEVAPRPSPDGTGEAAPLAQVQGAVDAQWNQQAQPPATADVRGLGQAQPAATVVVPDAAPAQGADVQATPTVAVKDVYGRTHLVRQSDLAGGADRIATVRQDGSVVIGEEIPLSIIKPTGATNAPQEQAPAAQAEVSAPVSATPQQTPPLPGGAAPQRSAIDAETMETRENVVQVAQPTSTKTVTVTTNTLNGPKNVRAKLYEMPGYNGPQLAVHQYKTSRGTGYRIYLPKSGAMVADNNGVVSLDDTLQLAVLRVQNARQTIAKRESDQQGTPNARVGSSVAGTAPASEAGVGEATPEQVAGQGQAPSRPQRAPKVRKPKDTRPDWAKKLNLQVGDSFDFALPGHFATGRKKVQSIAKGGVSVGQGENGPGTVLPAGIFRMAVGRGKAVKVEAQGEPAHSVVAGNSPEPTQGATHQDPGQPAEPATPAVVQRSLAKGDANSPLNIKQMRERLLSEIDAASKNAPSREASFEGVTISDKPFTERGNKVWRVSGPEDANGLSARLEIKGRKEGGFEVLDGRDKLSSAPNLDLAKEEAALLIKTGKWTSGGGQAGKWTFDASVLSNKEYVTFDVPGDGKFKVLNTAEGLAYFRKKVEASPGFREQRAPSAPAERRNASPDEVRRMVKEPLADKTASVEDLANAIEIARANGVDDIAGLLDRFQEVANQDYGTWRGEQAAAQAEADRSQPTPAQTARPQPAPAKAPTPAVEVSAAEEAKPEAQDEARKAALERVSPAERSAKASHDALMDRLREGAVTLAEYEAGWESLQANKEAIRAEFSAMTKEAIFKDRGAWFASRYKQDKKTQVVDAAVRDMMGDFTLDRSYSFGMGKGAREEALTAMVARTTQADLDSYAKAVTAAREERSKRMQTLRSALADPQSLADFKEFIRIRGNDNLSDEQRVRYDELVALKAKEQRAAEVEKKSTVQGVDAGTGMRLVETVHTRDKYPLFVVQMDSRVEADTYKSLLGAAKRLGGWYSSFKGNGAITGFQFKDKGSAEKFMTAGRGETVQSERIEQKQAASKNAAAQRLVDMADKMEASANEELSRERLANTNKRAAQASSAEAKARADLAFAQTLRNLAAAMESGEATHLDGIRTKAQVETLDKLVRMAKYEEIRKTSPDYGAQQKRKGEPATVETVKYVGDFPARIYVKNVLRDIAEPAARLNGMKRLGAKWVKLLGGSSAEYKSVSMSDMDEIVQMADALQLGSSHYMTSHIAEYKRLKAIGIESVEQLRATLREFIQHRGKKAAADRAKELERALVGQKVGFDFFPTPKAVAQDMVERADIRPGMAVLEPSAGNGNIAEAIRAASVNPDVAEISGQLRDVLEAKGFNVVAQDFMDVDGQYDRIIMNPPFSNGADIKHVQHAYDLLKPGGRIVAIVGEGAFYRSDKQATAFREWLDGLGATIEKLPDGTFADRTLLKTTGAAARIVEIDKPEDGSVFRSTNPDQAASNGVSLPRVEADRWLAGFLDVYPAAPSITVVSSFDQLPAQIQQDARSQGSSERQVKGVLHDGKVYVVAGNHRTMADFQATVFHEVLGHAGIRNLLGPNFILELNKLFVGLGGVNGLARIMKARGMDARFGDYLKGVAQARRVDPDRFTGAIAQAVLTEEVFAHISEQKGLKSVRDRFMAVIGQIRAWLRKNTFLELAKLGESDMLAMLQRSRENLAGGKGTAGGVTVFSAAWHGSPHAFDKFSVDNIGTGEGAQAYGWGLYFASKMKVAEYYRKGLTYRDIVREFRKEMPDNADFDEALEAADTMQPTHARVIRALADDDWLGFDYPAQAITAAFKELDAYDPSQELRDAVKAAQGRLYNVELAPAEDEYLDWDKPLSEQSEKVRAAISFDAMRVGLDSSDTGSFVYKQIGRTDKDRSQYLHSIGIRGIKYLDGSSRGRGDGDFNYVIFNDEDVTISSVFRTSDTTDSAASTNAGQVVTDLKGRFGDRLREFRNLALNTLGRRQLVDIYGDDIPQLRSYNNLAKKLDAEVNEGGAQADALARRWGALKDHNKLSELMHDATLAGIDADPDIDDKNADIAKRAMLRNRFMELSPEAQAVYREARDAYEQHYKAVRAAIIARIDRVMPDSIRRAELMKRMDDSFFGRVGGVYFPLARFGDYVVTVKDKLGNTQEVHFAETLNEANALRATLHKQMPGMNVGKVLLRKDFSAARDGVGREFVGNLFDVLDKAGVGADLQDAINQLYLTSLPDASWAKHGIHRKGTPGFSQDARRAYAQNVFHGTRYLAKLRYADQLEKALKDGQLHVDAHADDEGYDSVQAQAAMNEMQKRHESYMNPQSHPLAKTLTSVGYLFHMGLSPASAMVNLTQTPLVAYPVLAGKYGWGKAFVALLDAMGFAAANHNSFDKVLKGDELDAYKKAVADGVIDVTMAHDLAGIAAGEDQGVAWKLRPVMRAASFMFHHAEKYNRQATFLAAYRMAKQAGDRDPYAAAAEATYQSHFDYSSGNRPRIMQGNYARVLLLFKQFAQNTMFLIGRNAYLATKGDKQARRTLAALMVTHASAAGVLGLPIVGSILSVASFLGGDDDEPWDAEIALRNLLAETFGDKAGEVMAHGLSRLTPWDLSGRVGLNHLILPDIQEGLDGQRAFEAYLTALAGPVAGIGVNIAKGAQHIAEGRTARGLEEMMPAVGRSALRSFRYASEGAKDKTGVEIVDDTSLAAEIGQFIGFSPSSVREATEIKSAVLGTDRRIESRRRDLMSQWAMARMAGDVEWADELRTEEIARFNAKNPERAIRGLDLMRGIKARQDRISKAEGGVYLPRGHQKARDAVRFGGEEEE